MFQKNSLNFIKIPMAVFAIGFMLFCLPKLVLGHGQSQAQSVNQSMFVTWSDIKDDEQKTYRLFIAEPKTLKPESGWPLVLLLDGNTTFPIANSMHPNAILVGIGYPTDDREEIVQRRYFNLTSKAAEDKIPLRPGTKIPTTGGNEDFLYFITDKVLPDIKKQYKVDDNRITLFGHSLGGLFVMNTLLSKQSKSFQTYCAADPSIWWNGHEFMTRLEHYNKPNNFNPKLLIETSGQRTNHKNIDPNKKKRLDDLRSGPGGKEVANLLQEKFSLSATYKRFDDKNHGTMIAPSIQDCLAFSL